VKKFFQKLFGAPEEVPVVEEEISEGLTTMPLDEEELDTAPDVVRRIVPEQFIAGSAYSVGKQRDHNEDSLFTFSATIASNNSIVPFGVYIIADGMGGHQNGEVASEVAVRVMSTHMMNKLLKPLYSVDSEMPQESLQEIMEQGVMLAHEEVIRRAPGGGTTLTAAMILGNRMTIAHVGDSRAYAVFLDGRMKTLTRDHSLVRRLEELGQITAEEAEIHPQRNVLYRALGQGEPFDPDVSSAPIPKPGYLLICSDGLWGVVSDMDMYQIIAESPSPHRACQALIDAANAAGGPDNITAILVRMPE